MAGNRSDRQRIQQEIEGNKERIRKLELEIKTDIISDKKRIKTLEDGGKTQEKRIKTLEDKNKALEDKNKALEDRNEALQKEINDLKNKNEALEKQLQGMKEQIEGLEQFINKQKSVFIIAQIVPAIQRNMCKYVLGEHFEDKNKFYKVKDLKDYIAKLNDAEQKDANKRWSVLKDKDIWDQRLVDMFQELNQTRIGIAHPKLTSEKIQQAMNCLKEDLDEEMLINIPKLMEKWETSESLLQ